MYCTAALGSVPRSINDRYHQRCEYLRLSQYADCGARCRVKRFVFAAKLQHLWRQRKPPQGGGRDRKPLALRHHQVCERAVCRCFCTNLRVGIYWPALLNDLAAGKTPTAPMPQ